MIKLNMYSQYDHFPHRTTDEPSAPRMYSDGKIWEAMEEPKRETDMLLMIEPRSIQPGNYDLAMREYKRFKHIFTHDSQLLSFAPNALPIYYWRDYEIYEEPKTKDFSMICGNKQMCPLHIERMKLAEIIQGEVDILGDWKGGNQVSGHDAYAPYKFAVIIENYLDDYWFTEKLLNAFSTRTVPIYFGARKISKVFDITGIIQVKNLWDIPKTIEDIQKAGVDRVYNNRKLAIERNFHNVQKYRDFEDWFFKHYEGVLQELWSYQ